MAPTPRKNAALVRAFLTDGVDGGDTDAVSVCLADDVVDHNLVFERRQSPEEVSAVGCRVLAAADVDVDIVDIVATADRVAVCGTVSGIQRESLMDLAPTGRAFDIAYAWFCRIEGGQIAEIRSLPDGLGLMQHSELFPKRPCSEHWPLNLNDRTHDAHNTTPSRCIVQRTISRDYTLSSGGHCP